MAKPRFYIDKRTSEERQGHYNWYIVDRQMRLDIATFATRKEARLYLQEKNQSPHEYSLTSL